MAAAARAAHGGSVRLVLTARADGYLHGRKDLEETVARFEAYAEAGADVLFAPGVIALDDVARLVEVGPPVNVLALPGAPTVAELAAIGVARVSVGGAFAYAALGTLAEAAEHFRDTGTIGHWTAADRGLRAARRAFPPA